MEIVLGELDERGRQVFEVVICKCDVVEMLVQFAGYQVEEEYPSIVEQDCEVYWNKILADVPNEEHFPMARIKMFARPRDIGRLN